MKFDFKSNQDRNKPEIILLDRFIKVKILSIREYSFDSFL